MNAPMPATLLSPEEEAWQLRDRLLQEAFNNRDNGQFFRRSCEVEDAYADLSARHFVEAFNTNGGPHESANW